MELFEKKSFISFILGTVSLLHQIILHKRFINLQKTSPRNFADTVARNKQSLLRKPIVPSC